MIAQQVNKPLTTVVLVSGYNLLAAGASGPIICAVSRKYGKRPAYLASTLFCIIGTAIGQAKISYNYLLAARIVSHHLIFPITSADNITFRFKAFPRLPSSLSSLLPSVTCISYTNVVSESDSSISSSMLLRPSPRSSVESCLLISAGSGSSTCSKYSSSSNSS